MDLVKETHLLVDGDPLTYRFGIAESLYEGMKNLNRYLREVLMQTGATKMTIFLTALDCNKMYRYHVGKIKPYQGNRSGKSPNLPTRKAIFQRLLNEGAVIDKIREADDMLVDASNADPDNTWILSPDKDLHQAKGRVYGSDYKQPFHGYHALSQILQGDKADNIPSLVPGLGPKKAAKFLAPFGTLSEARQGVFELAKGDTLRLAEISALVLLGGSTDPAERVREFWGDLIPQGDLEELRRRCQE